VDDAGNPRPPAQSVVPHLVFEVASPRVDPLLASAGHAAVAHPVPADAEGLLAADRDLAHLAEPLLARRSRQGERDHANLMIGHDDETWDVSVIVPFTIIDQIVQAARGL
jgi:hypothetical protein